MTAAAMNVSPMAPVAESERHVMIDALRGFALLGVLIANFAGPVETQHAWLDAIALEFRRIVVHDTFYPMFCFLFGLGFAIQLLRAKERGTGVVRLYVRRMLALILIGTVHAVLIWHGDIVLDYALIGFLLIPLSRLSDKWLVPLVLALFVANTWAASFRPWFTNLGRPQESQEAAELRQVAQNANYPPRVAYTERVQGGQGGRLEAYQATIAFNWQRYGTTIRNRVSRHTLWDDLLMLFIVGLIVGRRGWLQNAARYKRGFLIAGSVAAVLTIAGNSSYFVEPANPQLRALQWEMANYGLAVVFIALFATAFASWPSIAKRLRIFVPVGQIGLTTYLMQSVVLTLVFERYGLGLPSPGTTWYLLLDVAFFFAVQVTFAHWWTKRFRFGPAEWVWRSMTYGELQPMRRVQTPPVVLPPNAVTPGQSVGPGARV